MWPYGDWLLCFISSESDYVPFHFCVYYEEENSSDTLTLGLSTKDTFKLFLCTRQTMETSSSSSSHEAGEGPQLHMEGHEDLDLLKQEIAEASTEEKKLSTNSSALQSSLTSLPDDEHPSELGESMHEDIELGDDESLVEDCQEEEEEKEDAEQETSPEDSTETSQDLPKDKEEEDTSAEDPVVQRPPSPIDESSWVLVDERQVESEESERTESAIDSELLNTLVYRKFIASRDLTQKLVEIGLGAVLSDKDSLNSPDMCKSIVFIHASSVTDGDDEEGQEGELPFPLRPTANAWAGVYAGAKVNVGVEEQAGLYVASVRVWHRDLLSALSALQSLVQSTGMISYADVDVPSLLARAA
ncbi:uncharacterized protein LOC143038525 [Oratosquilla oratoria]|uniref:uncharacterized protein LOC143038525 n=1 Tax=Oratosquilla oratoria TaxID=337810 RepID=UPI003F765F77